MLFVHEFMEYGDGTVRDNGWWEYDPDTEKVYNRNGGWHDYRHRPEEEIIESTWEDILARTIRDDSCVTGWIAPDGEFFGCDPMDHARMAEYYLKTTEQYLEDDGWIKITEVPFWAMGKYPNINGRYEYHFFNLHKHITQAQYKTLKDKGLELEEFDLKYNLAAE